MERLFWPPSLKYSIPKTFHNERAEMGKRLERGEAEKGSPHSDLKI